MLITFHSKAGADFTMFGNVAITLLKMMGHSGTVPGAISPEDIPAALSRLEQGLAVAGGDKTNVNPDSQEEDKQPPVPLRTRAYPLIQLLSAAAKKGRDVLWYEGAPLVP